ncbi:SpoIIE family protein phosphatase [Streptomyces phaeochromogenes]|uniref:SpoIIE family protein phosphatase n=1 Tax=Streptomyces phaeochromogenes TaxID=1923 RepID=UPI00398D0A8C
MPSVAETLAAVDSRGRVTAWGRAAVRLLGYESADMVGLSVHGLLATELPAAAKRGCAAREAWSGVVSARHRDGHRLELALHAQLLQGADGGPLWIVAASAPKQPDSEPDADKLKKWALAQFPMPVGVGDRHGRIVWLNDTSLALSGKEEAEFLGLLLGETEPGQYFPGAEEFPALAELALRTGDVVSEEIIARVPAESRERYWSTVFFPLKDPEGQVRGVGTALYDTTEQHWARRRLSLVNEATIRIGSTLDVSRTAQELADVGTDRFADFVTVDLLDSALQGEESEQEPTPLVFRRVAQQSVLEGCPEAVIQVERTHSYPEDSDPSRALATGVPSLHHLGCAVPQWVAAHPGRAQSTGTFGIHSLLVVPLQARGTTLGLAQFFRHRTPSPFDEEDLRLAQEITARAAVCVDNARRYTRERTTAIALQQSLLPRHTPRQSAVEVASRYIPAGSRAGVGGDWFDVIPLSGARVALVVGDVVGHGLHASAAMGRLRTAVRTLADVDLAPDELLTRLDDVVIRLEREASSPVGEFSATCLYAIYDPVSRTCSVASAGHVLPAVVGPDGVADFLDMPVGPPLGVGGFPFETADFELREGSLLALFTDGLIETSNRDIDSGLVLLGQALSQPSPSLEETCDLVLNTLLSRRPTDDIALLLARTHALDAGQVVAWDLPANPAVVTDARKHATSQLAAWGLEEITFTTELVVSELVTNAIRYGGGPIQLRLIKDATLICEVSDPSSTAPHLRRARIFDEGGRGLLLVAQLTDHWGTRQTPTGKIIWAEQAFPATGHDSPTAL